MAAGVIPHPGAKDYEGNEVFCIGNCNHKDCQSNRDMAKILCDVCKKPIGFDTRFYQENNYEQLIHAKCIE